MRKQVEDELGRLREQRRILLESWDYAFAMGSGCANDGGRYKRFRDVRAEAGALLTRIRLLEHLLSGEPLNGPDTEPVKIDFNPN